MLKVVLVDDSHDVQRAFRGLLDSVRGVEVVGTAEDTAGALRLIDAGRPDVVVLDIALRGGDRGLDVLAHVLREHRGTQVIVLSNHAWPEMREGFLHAGAVAFFDKSFQFERARDWIAARAGPAAQRAQARAG